MSSSGIQSINSGPLIIRTYNESNNTLSTNNTYLLGIYDYPISSNYILITTLNGQLAPTSNPTVSSMTVCTLSFSTGYSSTLFTSTFNACTITTSTLYVSSSAIYRNATSTINLVGTTYNATSDLYGKYVFLQGSGTFNFPSGFDGTFITLNNMNLQIGGSAITLTGTGVSGNVLQPQSTFGVMWFNTSWRTVIKT
jgi:hypothetical protein